MENDKYREENKHLNQINIAVDNKLKNLDKKIKEATKELTEMNHSATDTDFIVLGKQKQKYDDICDIMGSPYFARMNFKFDGEKFPETIYIGKIGIDFDDYKNNIVDWRAPIGDIFYKGSLGHCNYMFTDARGMIHTISGTKLLKRSIEIKDRMLVRIQDLETLAETKEKELELADKYLIEILQESSSSRLKDIIATIQENQNNIIREELNKIVFIQGCAGSGKSTIALHRIAYLLYYYRENLTEKDILVIAPNKLFLEYISRLLPDLGAVNIRQETFLSFAESIIGRQISYEKLDIEKNDKEIELFNKGQLKFKEVIDKYSDYLLENAIPKKPLSIFGRILLTREQLRKIFIDDFSTYKLNERIEKFKNYIEKLIQEKIKEYILEKEEQYNKIIDEFKREAGEYTHFQRELSELVTEKENVIKRINKQANIIINEYLRKIDNIDAIQKYTELITDKMILSLSSFEIITIEDMNNIITEGKKGLREDDIAGILYLYAKLNNINKNLYKHIVIDESQDLSLFEIYILKSFVYNNSFTILGDINQRIIPNKLENNEVAIANLFDNAKNFKKFRLNRSYRSSYEIMMFAKEILKFYSMGKEYLPDPIERHGDKPLIIGKNSDNEIVNEIINQITNREQRYKNTAIVFRTLESCKKYYELLNNKIKIDLITGENSYNGGVCIFPAYLTKGLEFDMVIIGDCDNKSYENNQLERNLLYVQSTRAMHSLVIMYNGTMSPLLLKIGKEFYNEVETDQGKSIKIRTAKETLVMMLNAKFGGINEQIEEIIKEELDYDKIQDYLRKVAVENDINNIFGIKNDIIGPNKNIISEQIEEDKKIENLSENKKGKNFQDDSFFNNLIDNLINDKIAESVIEYPYKSHSWIIESPKIAKKIIDKSVFFYNETGIPNDIIYFFGIKEIKSKNRIDIILNYNGDSYKAYFERDLINRAKLRWDKQFGMIVSDIISKNLEKPKRKDLMMTFQKIDNFIYNVDFI